MFSSAKSDSRTASSKSACIVSSKVSFTTSTMDLKTKLHGYIIDSQMGLDRHEAHAEGKEVINAFKKALFAKCERVRSEGESDFLAYMDTLKNRRKHDLKVNPDKVDRHR
jgi:hypothetical protein